MSTETSSIRGRRILLVIGGGIAAYKSLDLIRRLRERGGAVRVVMTAAAQAFITPLSAGAIAGEHAYTDLFDAKTEFDVGHIQLARDADLVVVAPATADLMAKMANGLADDLASTTLLATDKPVLMAPAMNVRMWEHPATQRNLRPAGGRRRHRRRPGRGRDGLRRVRRRPDGRAAGDRRRGRGVAGAARAARWPASACWSPPGPTAEPIDPVRVHHQPLVRQAGLRDRRRAGRPGRRRDPGLRPGGACRRRPASPWSDVETAREMLAACEAALPADVAVCVAAVADWRAAEAGDAEDQEEAGGAPKLALVENPDILATLSKRRRSGRAWWSASPPRPTTWSANAQAKRERKGCDWIVANDVQPRDRHHGRRRQRRALVSAAGVERWAGWPRPTSPAASPSASPRTWSREPAAFAISRLPHGEGLPLPAYETAQAAGMDLRAAVPEDEPLTLRPALAARSRPASPSPCRPGFEGQVRPRSGLAAQARRHLPQHARHHRRRLSRRGEGDPDQPRRAEAFVIRRGERIAQLVIAPVVRARVAEAEASTKRRAATAASARREGDRYSVPLVASPISWQANRVASEQWWSRLLGNQVCPRARSAPAPCPFRSRTRLGVGLTASGAAVGLSASIHPPSIASLIDGWAHGTRGESVCDPVLVTY